MNFQISFSLFTLFFMLGCASAPQSHSLLNAPGDLPPQHEISSVPFIEQTENYCGPATLAMMANWAGLHLSPHELAPLMFTPRKNGTLQTDYIGAVRRIGLIAITMNTLKNVFIELSHDHPVVVLQNLGSQANPIWHYAVIHGYDLSKEEIFLHSGKNKNLKMRLDQFERTWRMADYWALLALPPHLIPETASVQEVLNAAISLERVDKNQEANIVYQNILLKWPDHVAALFGLGNTFASLKKYQQSAQAFERASKLEPESGAIWNNLGEVYLKLKKKSLADHAFKKAVHN